MTDGGSSTGGTYRIGDAIDELRSLDESAAVVCLDDAWARPGRQGAFGVEYPTHSFEVSTEQSTLLAAADGGTPRSQDTATDRARVDVGAVLFLVATLLLLAAGLTIILGGAL